MFLFLAKKIKNILSYNLVFITSQTQKSNKIKIQFTTSFSQNKKINP